MNVRRFACSGFGFLLWSASCTACGGSPSASTAETPAVAPAAAQDPAAGAPAAGAEPASPPATPEPAADPVEPAPPAADDAAGAGPPPEGAEEGEFHEVQPPDDAAEALDLPSFSQLIGDGPTVTITVEVEGASAGELAFQTIDEDGFAHMIHVQRLEGGTATIVAPAKFDDPVYVSLAMPEAEFSPDPHAVGSAAGRPERKGAGMQVAGAMEPIRLQGADVKVTIKKGERPPWLEALARQGVRPDGGERAQ